MLVQDVTVATVDIINEEEDIDEDDEDVFVSVNGIGQVCLNWQDSQVVYFKLIRQDNS